MAARRELSKKLYDVLENVGCSEEMRQLHQDTATTQEILNIVLMTYLSGHLFEINFCGSSYEGSVTPDLASDIDIILGVNMLPVVADVPAAPPGASLLIVRDDTTYPGYVKLQFMLDGQPLTAEHGILPEGCTFDIAGRVCAKHMFSKTNSPAFKYLNEKGLHTLDLVPAVRCQTIPPFAIDCLSRPRPYERSVELQGMANLGCLFVGVGHINSVYNEKDIEWRMSFSLQEKQLMTRLNAVQHKVYVLLKMIKKNIITETLKEETLTSYHCKTCILYMVQMTAPRVWTDINLINCLFLCLKLLTKWVEKGACPSYWFKGQNLFTKEYFPRLRLPLLQLMRLLLDRGTPILYMIKNDNVGEILRNGDRRRYRELSTVKKNEYASLLKFWFVNFIHSTASVLPRLFGLSKDSYDPVSIASTLDALQRLETINGHTTEVTQSALAYMYPHLHLHIAKGLVSMTYRHPDTVDQQRMMEIADFHFSEARGMDLVNERLARASVLYRSEQYDECFLLLQNVENDISLHAMFYCLCTNMNSVTYCDIQDKRRQDKKTAGMTLKNYIQTVSAICVIFLPSELEIAPAPLQYEMQRSLGTLPRSRIEIVHYWYDWAAVDARVYLYFLQYLVSSKLHKDAHRQVAMDNLHAEIAEDDLCIRDNGFPRLGHKDTAYNLLGWIYMQEGRPTEAAKCFTQSWRIRPYHNAAKFHMRDLKAKMSERQSNK